MDLRQQDRSWLEKKKNVSGKDLDVIVTKLEIAALSLSPSIGSTFTQKELIEEAHSLCGDGLSMEDEDIKIVLSKHKFIRPKGKGKLHVK